MAIPISAADYYDFFPSTPHNPGDVWVGLPTFGVLPWPHLAGLVITPACDLSNRKVETITYVPIVPINGFITSRSAMPEIRRAVEGQLEAAGLRSAISLPEAFESPNPAEIQTALYLIDQHLKDTKLSGKIRGALTRAAGGLRLLLTIGSGQPNPSNLGNLRALLGDKAFAETLQRIITNARSDTHFLPADEQKSDWSAIPVHSVALFRFPLTLPIEVLDVAQRVAEPDWIGAVTRIRQVLPCVTAIPTRPMKRLRLLPRFGSDLVTRYTSMFGRLGSPDFTAETVSRFVSEIQEGR